MLRTIEVWRDWKMGRLSDNYEWFVKADLSKYKGKYVIIKDQRVVYSGENLKRLINKFTTKYPLETPVVTKVPKDDVLILIAWLG